MNIKNNNKIIKEITSIFFYIIENFEEVFYKNFKEMRSTEKIASRGLISFFEKNMGILIKKTFDEFCKKFPEYKEWIISKELSNGNAYLKLFNYEFEIGIGTLIQKYDDITNQYYTYDIKKEIRNDKQHGIIWKSKVPSIYVKRFTKEYFLTDYSYFNKTPIELNNIPYKTKIKITGENFIVPKFSTNNILVYRLVHPSLKTILDFFRLFFIILKLDVEEFSKIKNFSFFKKIIFDPAKKKEKLKKIKAQIQFNEMNI